MVMKPIVGVLYTPFVRTPIEGWDDHRQYKEFKTLAHVQLKEKKTSNI